MPPEQNSQALSRDFFSGRGGGVGLSSSDIINKPFNYFEQIGHLHVYIGRIRGNEGAGGLLPTNYFPLLKRALELEITNPLLNFLWQLLLHEVPRSKNMQIKTKSK